MGKDFLSFRKQAEIKDAAQMAAELAWDTCERYAELRKAAMDAETQAEAPMLDTPEAIECRATLDALMRGRHRPIVQRVIVEWFPEVLTPATATDAELAAAMQATADKPAN